LLESLVIPAEAEPAPHLMRGIQLFLNTGSLLSQGRRLDSRFHGNDNLGETTKESFQRAKVFFFYKFEFHSTS